MHECMHTPPRLPRVDVDPEAVPNSGRALIWVWSRGETRHNTWRHVAFTWDVVVDLWTGPLSLDRWPHGHSCLSSLHRCRRPLHRRFYILFQLDPFVCYNSRNSTSYCFALVAIGYERYHGRGHRVLPHRSSRWRYVLVMSSRTNTNTTQIRAHGSWEPPDPSQLSPTIPTFALLCTHADTRRRRQEDQPAAIMGHQAGLGDGAARTRH
jgi:hypothetical protein